MDIQVSPENFPINDCWIINILLMSVLDKMYGIISSLMQDLK
jgi:hypothetical protein